MCRNLFALLPILFFFPSVGLTAQTKGDISNLIEAIKSNNITKAATEIIKDRSLVNYIDSSYRNYTPLMYACEACNDSIAKILIDNGADIHFRSLNATLDDALSITVRNDCDAILKRLINLHINIDTQYYYYERVIYIAATHNSKKCMAILIKNGADIHVNVRKGATPLHYAALYRSDDVALQLIKAGADIEAKDEDNFTPLMWACGSTDSSGDVVEILLKNGANKNTATVIGFTCLMKAAWRNKTRDMKYLIEYGADVNAVSSLGQRVIFFVIEHRNIEVIQLLIDKGARLDVIDNQNKTPMDYLKNYQLLDKIRIPHK